jgi:hypothetical protein
LRGRREGEGRRGGLEMVMVEVVVMMVVVWWW